MHQRLDPVPPELSRVGYSSRFKIIRAAELHYQTPPIDTPAKAVLPLFEYFQLHTTQRQFTLSQYNQIRWALNYSDDLLAASAYLRFGQISYASTGPPFRLPSIHKLTQMPNGIMCTVDADHTLQDRMDYACRQILEAHLYNMSHAVQPSLPRYFSIGCAAFYSYRKSYVTLPPEMNQSIKGRILAYCDELLNKFGGNPEDVLPPEMYDPEEWLDSSESFFLSWDQFNFTTKATPSQIQQRKDNGRDICLQALSRRLIPANLDPKKEYTRKELSQYLSMDNFTTGVKQGFLTRVGFGKYVLTFLQNDEDEETEPEEV